MSVGVVPILDHCAAVPSNRRGGFTLIEMIAVITVIGIIAAVTAPTLSGLDSSRLHSAVSQVRRDLLLARHVAVATGMRTWVVFDVDANAYEVLQEPSGNPGRGAREPLTDASTGRAWRNSLSEGGFGSARLSSVSIAGAEEVGFDFRGRSLAADEGLLQEDGEIAFEDTDRTVTIRARTGHVE